ncbi:MAG: hypothetical protein JNL94_08225 [Planctomycetes bacterium]|nr:hypothetical protein [Planctomycetota bacterium]
MRALLRAVLLAGATSIAGCDLEFESQDVVIRHDVEGDALDVLLVYYGVSAGDGSALRFFPDGGEMDDARARSLEKGVAAFERIAAGEREGMIVDWPLHVTLDRWKNEDEAKLADPEATAQEKADAAARLPIYELVTLVECGAFLDDAKRLCGFQRVRIHPLSKFEALLNAHFDALAREDARDADDRDDPIGVALRAAKADAKTPWFRFDRGTLQIDVPMSMAERASVIRDAAEHVMKSDHIASNGFTKGAGMWSLFGEWLATAPSVALEKDRMRATFGTGDAPIRWTIMCPDRPYDPTLYEALKSRNVSLRDDVKAADLIAAMK